MIAIGCFIGLFTLVSGIVPQITDWHDDKTPSREVFGGIPGALQVAFYTVIPVMLVWGAFAFADRVQNWERGGPDRRRTTSKNAKPGDSPTSASGVYMRTLLRDPAAGVMHSMIYFGFLALLGVTTVLEIDHQMPEGAKFLHGTTYQALLAVRRRRRRRVPRRHRVGDRCAATCSGRIASVSRPSPSTRPSSAPSS